MLKRRIKSSSNLKINLEDFKGNSGNEKVVKQESGGNITPWVQKVVANSLADNIKLIIHQNEPDSEDNPIIPDISNIDIKNKSEINKNSDLNIVSSYLLDKSQKEDLSVSEVLNDGDISREPEQLAELKPVKNLRTNSFRDQSSHFNNNSVEQIANSTEIEQKQSDVGDTQNDRPDDSHIQNQSNNKEDSRGIAVLDPSPISTHK